MTTKITGRDAIEYARLTGAPVRKHADPIEGERLDLTPDEAEEVAAEDPSLIYVIIE